jgi:hypothetical protein
MLRQFYQSKQNHGKQKRATIYSHPLRGEQMKNCRLQKHHLSMIKINTALWYVKSSFNYIPTGIRLQPQRSS